MKTIRNNCGLCRLAYFEYVNYFYVKKEVVHVFWPPQNLKFWIRQCSQHSRCGPSGSTSSSINIGDDYFLIDIEVPDGSRHTRRNEAKLQKKERIKNEMIG